SNRCISTAGSTPSVPPCAAEIGTRGQKKRAGRLSRPDLSTSVRLPARALQEGPQALAARGVAQLAQRLALDLADALARHREGLADFFQGVLATVAYAEAHLEDHLLPGREGLQDLLRLLFQIELNDRVDRRRHRAVLD